jgi:inhibitor of KinA sporulation pathway (predicted exonuclease)|tara:strand:- start:835 stop:1428 length:594 start_codon:yes stop_codon:yes gene_type:complete
MSNVIIVYDTESTCWSKNDGTSSWWCEDWQEPEIIQISAIKIETQNFTEVGKPFDVFIKPTINPVLSDYCTDLTSITNAHLNKEGLSFVDGCKLFNAYCGTDERHSYGGDHSVLNYNLRDLYNLPAEINDFTGHDIRTLFTKIDPSTKSVNSGALSQHFKLAFHANQHYALDDCRSISESLKHFKAHPEVLSYFKRP